MGRSISVSVAYGFTYRNFFIPNEGYIHDIKLPKGVELKHIGYLGEGDSEILVYITESYEASWDYVLRLNPSYKPKASWDKLLDKALKALEDETEDGEVGETSSWLAVGDYG